jgi:hypothetical protein
MKYEAYLASRLRLRGIAIYSIVLNNGLFIFRFHFSIFWSRILFRQKKYLDRNIYPLLFDDFANKKYIMHSRMRKSPTSLANLAANRVRK